MSQSELLQVRRVVQVFAQPEEVVVDTAPIQRKACQVLKLEYRKILMTPKEQQLKTKNPTCTRLILL